MPPSSSRTSAHRALLPQTAQPEPVALFVSDVHLHPSLPQTTAAFLAFLREQAVRARWLYLLGDLFEYWAGDDDRHDPYHWQILSALQAVSASGVEVFWIAGNRDFLFGEAAARDAGLALLPDPFTLSLCGRRLILTHGDAYCTDDHAYQAFRQQVRDPAWQQNFLAQPLAARKQIIEGLRDQSRAAQRDKPMDIMDVNPEAISALFARTGADCLIHGHTHRPALHVLQSGEKQLLRYVLPDWELDSPPYRGGWLAMDAQGGLCPYDWKGKKIRGK